MHYIKTQMHSKMRYRVSRLQIIFEKAYRYGFIAKNFKTTIGGELHSDEVSEEHRKMFEEEMKEASE